MRHELRKVLSDNADEIAFALEDGMTDMDAAPNFHWFDDGTSFHVRFKHPEFEQVMVWYPKDQKADTFEEAKVRVRLYRHDFRNGDVLVEYRNVSGRRVGNAIIGMLEEA